MECGRADWAVPVADGQEGIALWGWQLAVPSPPNTPQIYNPPPPGNAATWLEEAGIVYSQGGGTGVLGLGWPR